MVQHPPFALRAGVSEPQRVRTPRGRGTTDRHRGSSRTNQLRALPDRPAGDPQPPSGETLNIGLRERFHSIGYRSPQCRWRQPSTVHRTGVGPETRQHRVCHRNSGPPQHNWHRNILAEQGHGLAQFVVGVLQQRDSRRCRVLGPRRRVRYAGAAGGSAPTLCWKRRVRIVEPRRWGWNPNGGG